MPHFPTRTPRHALIATALALAVMLGLTGVVPTSVAAPASAPSSTSAAPGPFTPTTRVMFNNPLGSEADKRRLFAHLVRSIKATPSDGAIRFAVYSFADKAIADALLSAHRRGVEVKLLFAGKNVYEPMKRMRAALGSDPRRQSFAIYCRSSCRGDSGQMHAKFFSFSQVGRAKYVTMVGSNNLTRHNSHDQWSDLYTVVGKQRYYEAFRTWFTSAKQDRPLAKPYLNFRRGGHRVAITPMSLASNPDPLMEALRKVTCKTRAGAINPDAPKPGRMVPTRIKLALHAWNGARGKRLAREVAARSRGGCKVRVYYGDGVGPAVRNIVSNAGAKLSNGNDRGVLTHQKLMIVDGHVGDQLDVVRQLRFGSRGSALRATYPGCSYSKACINDNCPQPQ